MSNRFSHANTLFSANRVISKSALKPHEEMRVNLFWTPPRTLAQKVLNDNTVPRSTSAQENTFCTL